MLVRNMVLRYMENSRSVMLTVVPANVDIATQEIIEMARELDPEGARTLRILTKPDLVDKGTESRGISMIEDQNACGQLGWVLVRNLGQQQLDNGDTDRDALEDQFRQSEPWNRVRAENFGIQALRDRLQEVLSSNVRREFPSVSIMKTLPGYRKHANKSLKCQVRSELIKKYMEAKKDLQSLGIERETPGQQRTALLGIVSSFQKLTQLALTTNYSVDGIFDTDPEVRLATRISNRNLSFADLVSEWGHEFAFKAEASDTVSQLPLEEENPLSCQTNGKVRLPTPSVLERIQSREVEGDDDVQDILYEAVNVEPAQDGITDWIARVHRDARGFEIGTFNPILLSTLMKKQSVKWPIIAQGYISDVIAMVHRFIKKALRAACGDSRISKNILSLLWNDLMMKYQRAIFQVDFILSIEREEMLMTLNHYLNDTLQKW